MFRTSYRRIGPIVVGALALYACASRSQTTIETSPAVASNASFVVANASTFRATSDISRFTLPGPAGIVQANGGAGFPAMTVTFTHLLIGDEGHLIADFARQYGIKTIFLPVNDQDIANLLARNPTTLANLKALFATCTVYIVTGDYTWLANPGRIPYDAYELSHRVGPMYPEFAGILYDIEPQLYPTWNSDRQGTIDRYFALLDTLFAEHSPKTFRTTVVTTIPAFARQTNRRGGQSPSMLQAIEAYAGIDGTYLLLAGNSAAAQLARAETAALPQMRKPYWAISNTAPESGINGYYGSTPQYLAQNMVALARGARAANRRLQGVDVSSWDDDYTSLQSILPQPTPPPVPQPTGPMVPPPHTDYIGAYIAPNGSQQTADGTARFEHQIGRKLAYDIHYENWDAAFPGSLEQDDAQNDRIPLLSWKCGDSNSNIAKGRDDALIRARAKAAAAFKHHLFLRYEWEMNEIARNMPRQPCYDPKTDLPDGYFSPTEYVAAWKRIRTIFKEEGANNVIWLWNPGEGGPDPAQYYPGDDQVDWVGLDSYDRKSEPFADVYVTLDDLSQFRKPMLIVETGALADYQAAYFGPSLETLKERYPLVRGYSYFDANAGSSWTFTAQGIAGYKALANSPLMSARQPH